MAAHTVSFTQMADGTAEDYELLDAIETEDMMGFPDRVLGWLHQMDDDTTGYQITRLDHPYYQATIDFCAKYDQNSFDPAYDSEPLDFFEPMLRRVLARPVSFESNNQT